ncbi:MAG: tyrosine--tRNA ligase, partial [Candidatus Moraniibacteriota bacterium]
VIDREHLKKRLLAGEKLRVKLGIDPTSPNLHLGRSVPLLKLRDFQDLGCQVVFIVGDFTGIIGDTSDKEAERPMLSLETIAENLKSYVDQAAKILDIAKVEVRHNSEWLGKLTYQEIGEQADAFSLAETIARENVKKRLDAGKRVSLRELLYPLMQGYDSVAVKADVELGGTDQRFNLLAGRTLQPNYDQAPQDILMTNLILGTDGRKMSSSWGNTINLLDLPNDMFGKCMSIPDEIIMEYFVHCTRVSMEEVAKLAEDIVTGGNPRDAKLRLAKEIVTLYYGAEAGVTAEQYFIETFSKGQVPTEMPSVTTTEGMAFTELLVAAGVATSKGDARRKIEQGGVSINEEKLEDFTTLVSKEHVGAVVKVGKKDFFRIVF